jgi:hypothetical protein
MKSKNLSPDQDQEMVDTLQPTTVAAVTQTKTSFKPSPDAVAQKAYFSYLNAGSQPGQEVRHWLEAEAQLLAGIEHEVQIHPH